MTPKEHPPANPPSRLTAILLGADAGGSHSAVAIGREDGTVLGRAEGPGAAMRPGGAAASVVVLADIARRAATQAVVSLPVDRAVVGAAGAGRAQEQQELAAALVAAGIARAARVLADAEVALATAFRSAPGIIINAGTGSIAYARDDAGRLHRCGGARGAGPRRRALFPGRGRDPGRPCGGSPVRNLPTGRGAAADARRRHAASPPADRAGGHRGGRAAARRARLVPFQPVADASA